MKDTKLFTPVDGVVVEIPKQTNTAGIELPESSSNKKSEGVIVSEKIKVTEKLLKDFGNPIELQKGTRIKFSEGYSLEDQENLYFVPLEKILGIYEN